MFRLAILLLSSLVLYAQPAHAWWNDAWTFRKPITIDTSTLTRDFREQIADVPVLLRLHAGNFSYFFDVNGDGSDIRFVAGDDITPISHHIEKFDIVNEMALIWIRLPYLGDGGQTQKIWMYYGNHDAGDAGDPSAVFDSHYTAVYHFGQKTGPVSDFTPFHNDALRQGHSPDPGSLIGCGLSLTGKGSLVLPENPMLENLDTGFTFSAWIKAVEGAGPMTLLMRGDHTRFFTLEYDGKAVTAQFDNRLDKSTAVTEPVPLSPDAWNHLALVIADGEMRVLLNGAEHARAAGVFTALGGNWVAMRTAGETDSVYGQIDELRFSNLARSPEALLAASRIEGPMSEVIVYGEDEQNQTSSGSTGYLLDVVRSIDASGWTIIVVLVVMGTISALVFSLKAASLIGVERGNRRFMTFYREVRMKEVAALAAGQATPDASGDTPGRMQRFLGEPDAFGDSCLYNVYRAALAELQAIAEENALHTAKDGGPAFDAGLLESLRAAMTVAWTSEYRRLKHLMVVMTVAISGAPFLGLLGTVVGVMITFAAIAATGDVNVNTIAPGIAGALATTVVGLCVAIPNLFAYNYLSGRINHIASETGVFTEQFISRLARQRVEKQGTDVRA